MWNTWLIGRRWKPCEGWSRPVLTAEGQYIHLYTPYAARSGPRGRLREHDGTEHHHAPRIGQGEDRESRHASAIRSPIHRERRGRHPVGIIEHRSCGGHGPGETPGPIPNPEAKTRHGDGTAPGRVWESSTPPQSYFYHG